jgi:hypothetical protein
MIGRAFGTRVREGKCIQKSLRERDNLETLGIYGRDNIKNAP